jgi:glycosyltransferase involved in cell wall biosynthesis
VIRVAAITAGRDDPSSRFRIRQFLEPLRGLGIEAVEYRPWISKYARAPWQLTGLGAASRIVHAVAARRYDVAWLNRELVLGRETIERFIGQRRLLDVDDGIWLYGRAGFARRIAARCAGVIAGNDKIADHFRGATPRVWTVPTSVDTDVWSPAPAASTPPAAFASSGPPATFAAPAAWPTPPATPDPGTGFTIGWSGTHWNLSYLYAIEETLARFLADHAGAQLLVVCNRRPRFRQLPADRIQFQPWSPAVEVDALRRMSVAIMPLADDEWSRAKCATKMLCAMAVGLPVVVSPVGAAAEILRQGPLGLAADDADDWYDGLAHLAADSERRAAMGLAGRRVAVASYSLAEAVKQLAAIFHEVSRQ